MRYPLEPVLNTPAAASGKIPLHIELRAMFTRRDDDRVEHELRFGVVGMAEPATVVVVSDRFGDPQIAGRCGKGGLDLPDQMLDALVLKCFRLLAGEIAERGGDSARWTMADASRWIRAQFLGADGGALLRELRRHVTPGLVVQDVCCLADDDCI